VANVCFDCEGCQVHYLKCENGSPTTQGFSADGNFQEYVAVHYRNVARVPDDMDLTSLAPLFCAGSTAYNSVVDTIKELEGEPADTYIAVVGCGGLGMSQSNRLYAFVLADPDQAIWASNS
jgi:propanol-preferring alcohol dehydrogenase